LAILAWPSEERSDPLSTPPLGEWIADLRAGAFRHNLLKQKIPTEKFSERTLGLTLTACVTTV